MRYYVYKVFKINCLHSFRKKIHKYSLILSPRNDNFLSISDIAGSIEMNNEKFM